jgi:hypothetical protein
MQYKEAYSKLLKTVLDAESIDMNTLKEVQNINNQVSEEPTENKPSDAERKKEIMSIRDNTERQQAIKENMELFK